MGRTKRLEAVHEALRHRTGRGIPNYLDRWRRALFRGDPPPRWMRERRAGIAFRTVFGGDA